MATTRARSVAMRMERLWLPVGMSLLFMLAGCSDQMHRSSAPEVTEFQTAETWQPSVDIERVMQARITPGPYNTLPGDILQVEMPRVLNVRPMEDTPVDGRETYVCRIHDDGTIVLPTVGPFQVAGKSLAQIESDILGQYYPAYVKAPFPVYVSVLEYNTRRVSIAGAVAKPGIYALRWDRMSLVSLLMEAGGIVTDGALAIRIARGVPENGVLASLKHPSYLESIRVPERVLNEATLHATFEREGPLCATGRLAVANADGLLIEKWVDLASESQRSEFVQAATGMMGRASASCLYGRLVELAAILESSPPGRGTDVPTGASQWRMTEDGRCTTLLEAGPVEGPSGYAKNVAAAMSGLDRKAAVETVVLPVRGLNIPFADVSLQEGDSVVVERLREQFITVLGLVRNSGTFAYPPEATYTLAQAIGLAGGLDMLAEPRYVNVYRLKPDGQVASLTVQLVDPRQERNLTEALALPLRPGDVVSVEHTPRTRKNLFIYRFLGLNLGLYVNPETLWE